MKNMTLNMNDLEAVNGGLLVYRGLWKNVWVVDDKTGKKLGEQFFTGDAKGMAISKGVSYEKISWNEYKKRFGK